MHYRTPLCTALTERKEESIARYLVLGAGAIGGTLGGHLHRAGREVVLVARAAHVAAIRARGLRLVTGDAEYRLDVPAVDSVASAAPFGGEDVVLLTCKAQHTAAALGELRAAGAPPTLPVVCCQNAIWNESHAQRVFANVYGAVVFVPGFYLDPGEVINARVGHYGYLEVGRYPAGDDALCARVVEDLAAAGFAAAVNPAVMRAKGAKCLGNLANAVAAITGSQRGAETYWHAPATRRAGGGGPPASTSRRVRSPMPMLPRPESGSPIPNVACTKPKDRTIRPHARDPGPIP